MLLHRTMPQGEMVADTSIDARSFDLLRFLSNGTPAHRS